MACEDIKARLDNAIAARDRLATGSQVVVIVDAFRSRVEYRPVDIDKLTAYIQLVTAEYQACLNPCKRNVLTRPVQFRF